MDHSILLSRLSSRFGIKGTVLAWLRPYLTSRKQFVDVNRCKPSQRLLERGVPQGSVLGSLLYLLYTSPLADIIKRYNLEYHFYADDTQLYVAFKTDCQCVRDIDSWMVINKLKQKSRQDRGCSHQLKVSSQTSFGISSNWQCDSCTIIQSL